MTAGTGATTSSQGLEYVLFLQGATLPMLEPTGVLGETTGLQRQKWRAAQAVWALHARAHDLVRP